MTRTVAIVGATGAVGRELRRLLAERDLPADEIRLVASERSAGTELTVRGEQVTVRALSDPDVFEGVDLALFSAGGGRSKEYAPQAVDAGALVVDNSSAWRLDPQVPLVVTEVNAGVLDQRPPRGIVANPNCTTMVAMLPLKALHDAFGLTGFTATSFQAAGGAGQKGIDELMTQARELIDDPELLRSDGAAAAKRVSHEVHAAPLAFNVVPKMGEVDERGYTDEEMKLQNESRKILGIADLPVTPTCVRVPVVVGHAIQVRATFSREVTASAALEVLEAFPNLLTDELPTPLEWAGRSETVVGRVRDDLVDPQALNLWVTGDNLLKGAALNTLQIAEELIARGHA
ncbi:aspartate-semialdehyde dehydrogenase [Egibacter rhizosphaerae]|uniref:Aspartate-semialdehyde dehydrogenase n=1 Tax=Egibacter rhizosphaerae TaxID=1670831 RepID=A0A411YDZ7_9ACTN|nr:aspartate-semialdehyde dehydrogenase [Egibacter rhizosphaerae]QBI19459.1 aspartate-semialdehyde dehydrogenase [Egibacter rhizosphaerae]